MKNAVYWDIKPSSYLTGDTLRLHYRAQPVNAMQDLKFSWQWLWRMPSSELLGSVSLIRTDVSEESIFSIIKTRMGELGSMLASDVSANVASSSPILVTSRCRRYVPPKSRFLQDPHGVTFQQITFFIITCWALLNKEGEMWVHICS
jgi:hypothetical protein